MTMIGHVRRHSLRVGASVAAVAAAAAAGGFAPASADAAPSRHMHKLQLQYPKPGHRLLVVKGTRADDRIALRLAAGDSGRIEIDVRDDGSPDFTVKRSRVGRIAIDARSGDDLVRIDDVNGAFTDAIPTALAGGDGDDTLIGGGGAELMLGGYGDDTVDGNRGSDVALLGAGDDTFVWDPGDGSDRIEGQSGTDAMRFNGSDQPERFELSANGNRLRFFRDPGAITMDTRRVERIDVNALGGADQVTVNDLSRTDVDDVNIDLAGALGGAAGDGVDDRIVVNGTGANDAIDVGGDASGVTVSGLRARVAISHQEPTEGLAVNGLAGNDGISAAGLAAGSIALVLDGGPGNDTLAGGRGVETTLGGDGSDSIDGNAGADLSQLGAGDDTFVWDPGDGSDTIEGQAGTDTMRFNGSNQAERFELSANGNRLRFFRDLGTITMDTDDVERVDVNALGAADLVTVNDLAGTDVAEVHVDFAGALGGSAGDGQADRVVVNGTNGNDSIDVSGDAGGVKVSGLAAAVEITHAEAANDRLEIATLAGTDDVDSGALAPGSIQVFVDGVLRP
jgi:Ca2+-binding RTX toxin-like protein